MPTKIIGVFCLYANSWTAVQVDEGEETSCYNGVIICVYYYCVVLCIYINTGCEMAYVYILNKVEIFRIFYNLAPMR